MYNLIKIKINEEWKTVFKTWYEYYKYNVILFELINILITCQKMINDALQKHFNVCVMTYLDNILMFLKTEKKHKQHVETVLIYLKKWDLLLKTEKCEFHKH